MALGPSTAVPEPVEPVTRAGARAAVLGSRLVGEAGVGRRAATLWGWPLVGTPEIVGAYDPPARRWLPGHRGIDLAGVAGEEVLAVDAGVVSYSGQIAGVGIVAVTHASGLRSTYQPVDDRVRQGARVGRNDPIGVLDVGGHCVLLDCLHLGARRGDTYVDPTPLLQPLVLSLLPVEPAHGAR
jgi:murein DD-endopeptidase MepM/ murein hydrolase activator NlpD